MEKQKAQECFKGLPLNVMANSKEIFDTLNSTEATTKISALFNYLKPGPESDLTKHENLVQFVKKCATRKIVDGDVEETAKITEKIRLGLDDKEEVHFYVKFGKDQDEYEINSEDTLTVVGKIYQQVIIENGDASIMQLRKELKEKDSEITRLQNIISENEKKMREFEEEKAKTAIVIADLEKKLKEATTKKGLSDSEKEAIVKAVKIEYNGKNLSIPTISQISDTLVRFATDEFCELTNRYRHGRRAEKNNVKRSIESWNNFASELEGLIDKNQREVLAAFNIPIDVWDNTNADYFQNNNFEVMMIHGSISQRLKMSLPRDDKPLDSAQLKDILRTQVELTKKLAENVKEIKQHVARQEEMPPIIQDMVSDKLFEIYGVEEEHIYGAMKAHMMDPEVEKFAMQLDQAFRTLLSS